MMEPQQRSEPGSSSSVSIDILALDNGSLTALSSFTATVACSRDSAPAVDQLEDDDPASKVGNRSKTRTSRQEISPLVKSDYINTSLNRSSSGVLTAEKAGGQPALQCFPQAYIPDDNKHPSICYFPAVHQALGDLVECSEGGGYWVHAVVTAYNEPGPTLRHTLESIQDQSQNLPPGCNMHTLVVIDGWSKISESMRRYLGDELFPDSSEDPSRDGMSASEFADTSADKISRWEVEIDGVPDAEWYKDNMPVTFTLQSILDHTITGSNSRPALSNGACISTQPREEQYQSVLSKVEIAPGKRMYVSVLIKHDNRRKHNSHEWFLKAFVRQYNSKYLFFTDAGTTHDQFCIPRLVNYMERRPNIASVTGFECTQALEKGAPMIQRLIRNAQAYELGPSKGFTTLPFQTLLGFSVNMPGPCQMHRRSCALNNEFLDDYFGMLNTPMEDVGIVHKNLQLVEDLPMAGYMYFANRTTQAGYAPDAFYYYDTENEPSRYLRQRRRWYNGMLAALHMDILCPLSWRWLWGSGRPWYIRLMNVLVLTEEYLLVIMPILAPGIVTAGLFTVTGGHKVLAHMLKIDLPSGIAKLGTSFFAAAIPPTVPFILPIAYFVFLVIWVVCHNRSPYIPVLFYIGVAMSICLGIGFTAAMPFFLEYINSTFGVVWLVSTLSVFFGACLSNIVSALLVMDGEAIRAATVGLPLFVAWYPMQILVWAYSISRFADFSWGTRPDTSFLKQQGDMERCKRGGLVVMAFYLISNFLMAILMIVLGFVSSFILPMFVIAPMAPTAVFGAVGCIFTLQYMIRFRWSHLKLCV